MSAEARARLERLHFYVDSLTNIERSKLAARYIRKIPPQYRLHLLRRMTIADLAFCEVFSRETYGW
jgi:hypothetical protein